MTAPAIRQHRVWLACYFAWDLDRWELQHHALLANRRRRQAAQAAARRRRASTENR